MKPVDDDPRGRRGMAPPEEEDQPSSFTVQDRRHWARTDREPDDEEGESEPSTQPTIVDEYRRRAEAAEEKLRNYIAAFKQAQADQDAFRQRLQRDVERRVELEFGRLVAELLDTVDDLELALSHVEGVAEAEPLARGVALARDRFLQALERAGVQRIDPLGQPFDPNEAEAVRVDAVDDPARDGKVVETLRLGYRCGERVVRAAHVAVGRSAT